MRRCALLLTLAACGFQHGALSGGGSGDDAAIDGVRPADAAPDGFVNACATNNGGCAAACQSTGSGTKVCYVPQTCADVAAHVTVPNDSTVTLYANGDSNKPWTAFCHGGKEYLTAASATTNFGQYTAGGKSPGTDVRTTYARLRINPATLKLDICDQTFTTSTGTLMHDPASVPNISVTSMPLGVAMDCAGNNSQTGVAAVNVTSLPFKVTNIWVTGGNSPQGTMTPTNNRMIAITGGGNCGWAEPNNGPYNPFNTCTNGELITLVYAP